MAFDTTCNEMELEYENWLKEQFDRRIEIIKNSGIVKQFTFVVMQYVEDDENTSCIVGFNDFVYTVKEDMRMNKDNARFIFDSNEFEDVKWRTMRKRGSDPFWWGMTDVIEQHLKNLNLHFEKISDKVPEYDDEHPDDCPYGGFEWEYKFRISFAE